MLIEPGNLKNATRGFEKLPSGLVIPIVERYTSDCLVDVHVFLPVAHAERDLPIRPI